VGRQYLRFGFLAFLSIETNKISGAGNIFPTVIAQSEFKDILSRRIHDLCQVPQVLGSDAIGGEQHETRPIMIAHVDSVRQHFGHDNHLAALVFESTTILLQHRQLFLRNTPRGGQRKKNTPSNDQVVRKRIIAVDSRTNPLAWCQRHNHIKGNR